MHHRRSSGLKTLLAAAAVLGGTAEASGFWRIDCGRIQTGRIDPIVSPGKVSSHCHNVGGAYNFDENSTYTSLRNSPCTSCEITVDKSAYWTPYLYYQYPNGTFVDVPNSGMIIYYLGRGDNLSNAQPFPPGFAMLSGSNTARSYDNTTKTWDGSRNVADRVDFACLDEIPYAETPGLEYTNCSSGLRAEIHFQSCWDGVNLYKSDNSHVDYMSDIDNGACSPTHPVQLVHLFYEVLYSVNSVPQLPGGKFVFSNGDTTGYGFHGDFLNGWDTGVLTDAIQQCAIGNNPSGQIITCLPLNAVDSQVQNCPERPPLVNETVKGYLSALPGCNQVTYGPQPATAAQTSCNSSVVPPAFNPFQELTISQAPVLPVNGSTYNSQWVFMGSAAEPGHGTRALNGALSTANSSMTIESCMAFCAWKNYPLAGVEYGNQCYCDNNLSPATSYNQTYSTIYNTMVCAGNQSEYCGGPNEVMVYMNTAWQAPFPSAVGQTLGNAKYLGCASEGNEIRALGAASTSSSSLTIQSCASYCSNYLLFGVEYASQCYCANSLASSSVLNVTGCNMYCSGNGSQLCGGPSRLNLFQNLAYSVPSGSPTPSIGGGGGSNGGGSTQPTASSLPLVANSTKVTENGISYTYVGCANENSATAGRALGGLSITSSAMTNELCNAYCVQNNYLYAGTEYGSECYCGNTLKSGSTFNNTGCTQSCAGTSASTSPFYNYTNTCGGSNRLTVWKNSQYTAVQNPVTVNGYASQGCYTEASNNARALSSKSYTSSKLTVETCITYCSSFTPAYTYAGVEFGTQCFCGNSLSAGANSTDSSQCSMLCGGNNLEYCGGSSRLNLYLKAAKSSRIKRFWHLMS
jgi:hypothetical protein